jgi:two-component system CheB/CheR fusion protein
MDDAPIPLPAVPENYLVVGIGASAGGLRALTEFFEAVPKNSGMAYVVVVHMSPEHESRRPDLLQQATAMPVEAVRQRVAIEPDHVYVISPKSELRMHDGTLEPSASGKPRLMMTIDLFLQTLAEAHRPRQLAILEGDTDTELRDGDPGQKAEDPIRISH